MKIVLFIFQNGLKIPRFYFSITAADIILIFAHEIAENSELPANFKKFEGVWNARIFSSSNEDITIIGDKEVNLAKLS